MVDNDFFELLIIFNVVIKDLKVDLFRFIIFLIKVENLEILLNEIFWLIFIKYGVILSVIFEWCLLKFDNVYIFLIDFFFILVI